MTDVLEAVVGAARDQLLHRDQLRYLHIDAGGAMLGDGADHVALGEHADRGVALGAHDVLDHQRADIAGAQQLRGDGDGLIHANRRDAGVLLAQDVSDFHRNLLQVVCNPIVVYIMPIVKLNRGLCPPSLKTNRGSNTDVFGVVAVTPAYHTPAVDVLENRRYTRLGPYLFRTFWHSEHQPKKERAHPEG